MLMASVLASCMSRQLRLIALSALHLQVLTARQDAIESLMQLPDMMSSAKDLLKKTKDLTEVRPAPLRAASSFCLPFISAVISALALVRPQPS